MVPMTSAHFIPILLETTLPIEQKKTISPNTRLGPNDEEEVVSSSSHARHNSRRRRTHALAALTRYGS